MATLHMETERVREIARLIDQRSAEMLTKVATLRSASGRLSTAWQGGEADAYQNELRGLLKRLDDQVDALQLLSIQVNQEVDEWQEADRFWQNSTGGQGSDSILDKSSGTIGSHPYNWFSWWMEIGSRSADGLKSLGKLPYTSYKSIGRLLNKFAGSPRAGWVGKMDDLGHIIKSPAVKKMIPFIGFGFGVLDDIHNNDDWGRAIGSELVDTGLNLIPVIGLYNAGLGLVNIGVGIGDLVGYHDWAARKQEDLEKWDFTEKMGDAIYDFFTEKPVSATVSFANPFLASLNPDYQRFTGKFVADNLNDFGFTDAAHWVQNTTEQRASNMDNIYSGIYDFFTGQNQRL